MRHHHKKQQSRSPSPRRRSSDRDDASPLVEKRRRSLDDVTGGLHHERSTPPYDFGDDVEYLPDRFDSQGRPLVSSPYGSRRWTERSGQFAKKPRDSRRARTWDVNGAWNVGGTDPEVVERMAKQVRDVVDGRMGWLGLISGVVENLVDDGEGQSSRRSGRRPR